MVPLYANPLPATIQFLPDTAGSFEDLVLWIAQLVKHAQDNLHPDMRIVEEIITYRNSAAKTAAIDGAANRTSGQGGVQLTPQEIQQYVLDAAAGATLSEGARRFKVTGSGSIGLVCSSMSPLVPPPGEHPTNIWHVVGIAWHNGSVFIHDTEFNADDWPDPATRRVSMVAGSQMVQALLNNKSQRPNTIYYQGPPTTLAAGQQECMGRSAQWVEATVNGTLPWPPNANASGGQWTKFRYRS
jgi:hypothetical protein